MGHSFDMIFMFLFLQKIESAFSLKLAHTQRERDTVGQKFIKLELRNESQKTVSVFENFNWIVSFFWTFSVEEKEFGKMNMMCECNASLKCHGHVSNWIVCVRACIMHHMRTNN